MRHRAVALIAMTSGRERFQVRGAAKITVGLQRGIIGPHFV
jgi:hypothetical protein